MNSDQFINNLEDLEKFKTEVDLMKSNESLLTFESLQKIIEYGFTAVFNRDIGYISFDYFIYSPKNRNDLMKAIDKLNEFTVLNLVMYKINSNEIGFTQAESFTEHDYDPIYHWETYEDKKIPNKIPDDIYFYCSECGRRVNPYEEYKRYSIGHSAKEVFNFMEENIPCPECGKVHTWVFR